MVRGSEASSKVRKTHALSCQKVYELRADIVDNLSLSRRASEVRTGILKGFILSSTIAAVIFFFEMAFFPKHLFPSEDDHEDDSSVGSIGSVFWLYPVIAGSYYLASTWTLDVAHATYRIKHGRSIDIGLPQQLPAGFTKRLTLESHRILLVINYGVISLLLQHIPWIGRWLSFAFMVCISNVDSPPRLRY
jgi:etoposide-induced 2.4 mRNA